MCEEYTILVIDDDREDLYLANLMLSQHNIEFNTALLTDSERALSYVKQYATKIAAIIVDINMPKISGLEILSIFKDLNIEIPVIVISGSINEEITEACITCGATDVMSKQDLSSKPQLVSRRIASYANGYIKILQQNKIANSITEFQSYLQKMSA